MEKYLKRIADSLERAFPLKPDNSFFEKVSGVHMGSRSKLLYTGY